MRKNTHAARLAKAGALATAALNIFERTAAELDEAARLQFEVVDDIQAERLRLAKLQDDAARQAMANEDAADKIRALIG